MNLSGSGVDVSSKPSEMHLDDILELMPCGKFHYRLLVICGMSFMADAMEVTLLSFISICAGADWDLSDQQVATISSSVFVGILFGNLFWGPIADKYGRRLTFLLGSFIIILFGILTGVATNYPALLTFRVLCGFGLGGATVPFDLLAEFLPQSARGQFLININYFWTLGSMFVAGSAWAILSKYGWHNLAFVTAIPVAVSLAWAVYALPESARWLLQQGRIEEAEKILRSAAEYNGTPLPPFTLKRVATDKNDEGVSIKEFFSPSMLPISIPLWTLWACFGFCYYGVVLLISRVFQNDSSDDDGYTCDFQYADIFISAVSEVGGVAICAIIIDRLGRVHTQITTYIMAGVGVFFMGISLPNGWLTFFSIIARMASLASTCATWVATPELYPTRMRATGHSVASSVARIGSFSAPFLVNSSASVLVIGLIFLFGNLMAALSSYFLPETKDSQLDARLATVSTSSRTFSKQQGELSAPMLSNDHVFSSTDFDDKKNVEIRIKSTGSSTEN